MTNEKSKIHDHQSTSDYFQGNTISPSDILVVLARQIKMILTIPSLTCIITIIYAIYFTTPIYESTSKIISSSPSNTLSQSAGLAAQFGISLPISRSRTQWVYPEVVKSRTLARSMLKRKFDTKKYGPNKHLLQILTYGNEKPGLGLDTLEILAVDKFLSMVQLTENQRTGIYTITLSAFEPHFVSELNAALIEELDIHQREYNQAKTSETRQFIEERINSTEKELKVAEGALKDFRIRNRRIENSPALQLEEQRFTREVSVLTGVVTTLKQQLETAKIEEVKKSNYVITLDPPEAPLESSKPKKKRMVILAGLLGIGFGIIIGFFREYIRNFSDDEKEKIDKAKSLVFNNISDLIPVKTKNGK